MRVHLGNATKIRWTVTKATGNHRTLARSSQGPVDNPIILRSVKIDNWLVAGALSCEVFEHNLVVFELCGFASLLITFICHLFLCSDPEAVLYSNREELESALLARMVRYYLRIGVPLNIKVWLYNSLNSYVPGLRAAGCGPVLPAAE